MEEVDKMGKLDSERRLFPKREPLGNEKSMMTQRGDKEVEG